MNTHTHRPLSERLERARELLERSEVSLTLAELGREVGLSPTYLQRRFRERYGLSPAEYAAERRQSRLRRALRDGTRVTDAVYDAGYGAPSRVYESGATRIGMTPSRYRRGGEGMAIRYTVVDTPLGRALIAVTERGLCAVQLGDDEASLETALREEFPRADVERVDAGRDEFLAPRIAAVTDALAGKPAEGVPLDVVGTAFQRRVWEALLAIPAGETRSYSELAAAIGEPAATRAVARACGANRIAVVVPCHRVVREDGSLGGYRWGLPRKRILLERESGAPTRLAGGAARRHRAPSTSGRTAERRPDAAAH